MSESNFVVSEHTRVSEDHFLLSESHFLLPVSNLLVPESHFSFSESHTYSTWSLRCGARKALLASRKINFLISESDSSVPGLYCLYRIFNFWCPQVLYCCQGVFLSSVSVTWVCLGSIRGCSPHVLKIVLVPKFKLEDGAASESPNRSSREINFVTGAAAKSSNWSIPEIQFRAWNSFRIPKLEQPRNC